MNTGVVKPWARAHEMAVHTAKDVIGFRRLVKRAEDANDLASYRSFLRCQRDAEALARKYAADALWSAQS